MLTSKEYVEPPDAKIPLRAKRCKKKQIQRIYLTQHPILIQPNPTTTKLNLHEVPSSLLSHAQILSLSQDTILTHIQQQAGSVAHPHRIIYCATGLVFAPSSPMPFGGPRMAPGYTSFVGETCDSLLEYLLDGSYAVLWKRFGRTALEFVVEQINRVIEWHGCVAEAEVRGDGGGCGWRNKGMLDELLLQGMKRAGHIPWRSAAIIPEYLRDKRIFKEAGATRREEGVWFTPVRNLD
ncbi:hypothetical protein BDR26DRAFT_854672 [Obelidium mucronatum]|nr:hypothetical protein BDR26DRAFT_854672 [Obelidium mucronatum]